MRSKTWQQGIAFLLLFAGCQREPDVWLTVVDEPSRLSEAREQAERQRRQEIENLLDHLDSPFIDSAAVELLKSDQGSWIKRVCEVAAENKISGTTVGATIVLCQLGDATGFEHLLRILKQGPANQRVAVLKQLNYGVDGVDDLFGRKPLQDAMLARLNDPDPDVVAAAVQACGRRKVPGAVDEFSRMLAGPNSPARERLCYWLSRLAPQASHVQSIEQLMAIDVDATKRPWWAAALLHFVDCDNDDASRAALHLLRQQQQDAAWKTIDLYLRQQIDDARVEHGTAEDRAWLESRLASDLSAYKRCRVLQALARIDPTEFGPLLDQALLDPELKLYAAQAISQLADDSSDSNVVRQLDAAATNEKRPHVLAGIAEALMDVGGDEARRVAIELAGRLEPEARMQVRRKAQGWSLETIMDKVVKTGLLNATECRQAVKELELDDEAESGGDSLEALLWTAGVCLGFDVETGELPCRHDRLVLEFARASRGTFQPEAVSQQWHQQSSDDYEAEYTLQFINNGRLFRSRLRNLGDWYDVERVVLTINRALQEAGRAEQFAPLYGGGQFVQYIFATPRTQQMLASELYLPVENDLNRAMQSGKDFEQQVLDKYREQGENIIVP